MTQLDFDSIRFCTFSLQVGRRADEFSKAQEVMREALVQRSKTAAEEASEPAMLEPANCGSLGGELPTHYDDSHVNQETLTTNL